MKNPPALSPLRRRLIALMGAGTCGLLCAPALAAKPAQKKKILIVDSYHKDYLWSQSTQSGVNAAMRKLGYLENERQARQLIETDGVETAKASISKEWMDTKRKNTPTDVGRATTRIMQTVRSLRPDLVMLGDDNAARYIGDQLIDTPTPVVFWGVNGLPLKYGHVKSMDAPGHNITGVWQSGYHKESLELLKRLVPAAKTFAILACDSESSRPNIKMIEQLAQRGDLPLRLVEKIVTNSYEEFKSRALETSKKVDAFFLLNHDTLRDRAGNHIDVLTAGRWYLENIRIPEASHEDQFVHEGMLLTANDSGYNQGFVAFEMAYDILERGVSPARMAVKTPLRGPYLVNRHRAEALKIPLKDKMFLIDELVERSVALGK